MNESIIGDPIRVTEPALFNMADFMLKLHASPVAGLLPETVAAKFVEEFVVEVKDLATVGVALVVVIREVGVSTRP